MSDAVSPSNYARENIARFKETQMSSVGYGVPSEPDRRRQKKAERGGTRGFRVSPISRPDFRRPKCFFDVRHRRVVSTSGVVG